MIKAVFITLLALTSLCALIALAAALTAAALALHAAATGQEIRKAIKPLTDQW